MQQSCRPSGELKMKSAKAGKQMHKPAACIVIIFSIKRFVKCKIKRGETKKKRKKHRDSREKQEFELVLPEIFRGIKFHIRNLCENM